MDLAVGIASIAVAAALVFVTYVLARHTRNLAHATDELRKIEERKEKAEARRRRIAVLRKKIELTQRILAWDFRPFKDSHLIRGAYPSEGDTIMELAVLIEYGKDHANKEQVEGIVRVLDMLKEGIKLDEVPANNFVDSITQLKKLAGDIPRWEKESMALSMEENLAIREGADYR